MNTLEKYAEEIKRDGPRRVVVNLDGVATTPLRARLDYDINELAVIFVRADGWSLAAPEHLVNIAEEMWKNEWIGVMRQPDIEFKPYP
jgi:hypothetical protein